MWEYSDEVKKYFLNPKNVGELKDANVVAEVGSMACGDVLKLMLKVEDGVIQEAKFQTFGCASAIASSSMLTEIIKGKNLKDALKLTNQDIIDKLGGLPKAKIHCSVMAEDALKKAGAIYFKEDSKQLDKSRVVCKCFNVTENKIRDAINENHLKTLKDVMDYTKAGGGCGNCIDDIQEILDDELKLNEIHKKKMNQLNQDDKIRKVISEKIEPMLKKDNGGIRILEINDNDVKVKLVGSCGSCIRSMDTIKNFVEKEIRTTVNEKINIIQA